MESKIICTARIPHWRGKIIWKFSIVEGFFKDFSFSKFNKHKAKHCKKSGSYPHKKTCIGVNIFIIVGICEKKNSK